MLLLGTALLFVSKRRRAAGRPGEMARILFARASLSRCYMWISSVWRKTHSMRDPEVRRLVILGYTKLGLMLVGLAFLLLPILLHPGLQGARVSLVLEGTLGVLVAVWQGVKRAWSPLFSGTALVVALLVFVTAVFVTSTDPGGIALKQILVLTVLGTIWYGLPAIRRFERNRPE